MYNLKKIEKNKLNPSRRSDGAPVNATVVGLIPIRENKLLSIPQSGNKTKHKLKKRANKCDLQSKDSSIYTLMILLHFV